MPQISKQIPIKSYQNIPATFPSQEYMNYLGRLHTYNTYNLLATDAYARYIFYHSTRPFGLSIKFYCPSENNVIFFHSEDTGLPGEITPISNVPICTNRYQQTVSGINIGTLAATVDGTTTFWNLLTTSVTATADQLYQFGGDQVGFICAPAEYYVLQVQNLGAAQKRISFLLKFTDFLGVL